MNLKVCSPSKRASMMRTLMGSPNTRKYRASGSGPQTGCLG